LRAAGRLHHGPPVAVLDIGSNSVRLVVYEGLARSPTPVFNEKVLCGLGREVQSTGLLARDAVASALAALRRFRAICDTMKVGKVWAIATAACREAKNGPAFVKRAQEISGTRIEILSGKREAQLSALGVISGFHEPNGIVGDLGGGSLECVSVRKTKIGAGITMPLGGLALADRSEKSIKKADKIVAKTLKAVPLLRAMKGRPFYAVGGTWRALARLHMWQTGYPLHVMHGYEMTAKEALDFCRLVRRVDTETLSRIDAVSKERRTLLPYAALVMEHLIRVGKPSSIVISALGLREGLLHGMLPKKLRETDALIAASSDLNVLRSRSPRHGEDLIGWTDLFMASSGINETAEEKRLRHSACLLADIGWRTHPDYRGEQSLNIIANNGFFATDHKGRAFLALTVFYRHMGLIEDELSPRLRELATTRMLDHARVLGAAMRVAYIVSASMPGVLPKTPMVVRNRKLTLVLKGKHTALASERVYTRLKQLGRLIGREPAIVLE
jgi:exopolyphosphatase/guanosine-5'-triphosphate,3'-diphosphate pyrophosphatase